MKKLSLLLVSLIVLTSCTGSETSSVSEENAEAKQAYNVDVVTRSAINHTIEKEKTATITASSQLTLLAQTSGEVALINFQEGKHVNAGASIVSLRDTVTNADLALAQARNGIVMQDASTETTKVNLDQSIEAAEAARERAKLTYDNLVNQTGLQYANTLKNNNQTLKTYNESYGTYLADADRLMTQLLHEGDKILGMTSTFENSARQWEAYLGARVGDAKKEAEDGWNNVYAARGEIRKKLENPTIDPANSETDIALVANALRTTREYTDKMIYMLQNNVLGASLPTELNTMWNSAWNGYRASVGGSEQAYAGWKAQTKTFFDTYSENAEAIKLATLNRPFTATEMDMLRDNPSLKLAYDNVKLDIKNNIAQAELALKQAEDGVVNAKKLRDATLNQLNASRSNAELALAQAQRAASKLSITAPVSGIVTKVLVEKGQFINAGTPVAEFSGKDPQAVIEVDPRVALLLPPSTPVKARFDDETVIEGIVTASSPVAGSNMLSTVRLAFPKASEYIGRPAVIIFEFSDAITGSKNILLPINSVKIIEEGIGKIAVLENGNIKEVDVRLGVMYGKNIEVYTDISDDTEIILSDVSSFDPNKHKLTVRTSTLSE